MNALQEKIMLAGLGASMTDMIAALHTAMCQCVAVGSKPGTIKRAELLDYLRGRTSELVAQFDNETAGAPSVVNGSLPPTAAPTVKESLSVPTVRQDQPVRRKYDYGTRLHYELGDGSRSVIMVGVTAHNHTDAHKEALSQGRAICKRNGWRFGSVEMI